jgi:nucleobase:cation symporter-1, NCS1 family
MTPVLFAALVYLLVRLALRADYHLPARGGLGFWVALDLVIAYNASWLPLVPDYTRYTRDPLRAALGAAGGYFLGTTLVLIVGVLAATLGDATETSRAIAALAGLGGGVIAAAVLIADESEKTFANVYSTAVSFQNLAPRFSQRAAIVVVAVVATVIAYQLSVSRYLNFLYLLGAVFVPLFGAVIADRLRDAQPAATVTAWVCGFLVYEWISPSGVTVAAAAQHAVTRLLALPFQLGSGSLGASLPAFAVAFAVRFVASGLSAAPRRALTLSRHGR